MDVFLCFLTTDIEEDSYLFHILSCYPFLSVPLLPPTRHTINDDMLDKLKPGVILINSSRGGLVDTKSVLKGIQAGIISGYGADVYENESDYFFQDWSARSIPDPTLLVSNICSASSIRFFSKHFLYSHIR